MFRPCIDLHEGKVKQIVGGTLESQTGGLRTNFVSERPAVWFAERYKRDGLTGGHVILLGPGNETAAREALAAYPGGLQLGGGVNADNAKGWLDAGASHVIVTSWVFREGRVDWERLGALVARVGKARLVLDLSCRWKPLPMGLSSVGTRSTASQSSPTGVWDAGGTRRHQVQEAKGRMLQGNLSPSDGEKVAEGQVRGDYFVVTDRWQKFTELSLRAETLQTLAGYCAEFLIHAVDVEGLCRGIDAELVAKLAEWTPIPTTYAGGAKSLADLEEVTRLGRGRIDLTIGSALDIFGGSGVRYTDCVAFNRRRTHPSPTQ